MGSPETLKKDAVGWQRGVLARWAMAQIFAALLLFGSSAIHAETESTDASAESSAEEKKPGFGLELGAGFLLHSQGQDAGVSSGGTAIDGRVEPALAPGFTVDATVLSPPLFEHEYAPSAFFQIGYQNVLEDSFATFRGVAAYSPSDVPNVVAQECAGGADNSSCDIRSSIDTSIDNMWYLGVGFQVPTPIFEDRLKLRFALDYLGQQWGDADFSWSRTTNLPAFQGGGQLKESVDASLPGVTTHALGFSTATLVDVYQWKGLNLRLFLDLRFAWILNDPGGDYSVSEPGVGDFQVLAVPDKFIAQAGGGIQVYWSPNW